MHEDREAMMAAISRNTVKARIKGWVDNFKSNLQYVHGGYGVASLAEVFKQQVPCIIVGSGPTLDWNIKDLKEVGDRACIIACDSVAKALLDNGIMPHLVMTTDSKGRVAEFLRGALADLNVISDTFVHPKTSEVLMDEAKRVYWYSTGNVEICPFTFALNQWTGWIGNLGTGGCVATTAWWLGVCFLQAEPDILVGLPESFYDPGQMYATAVEKTVDTEPYEAIPVEETDIHGRVVYTYPALQSFAHWFHDSFKKIPTIHINCSEGGILHENILNQPLKYTIEKYLKTEYDIEGILFEKEIKAQEMIDSLKAFNGVDLQAEKPILTILQDGPSLSNLALRMGCAEDVNAIRDKIEDLREAGIMIDEGISRQQEDDLIIEMPTFQLTGVNIPDDEQNETKVIELPSVSINQNVTPEEMVEQAEQENSADDNSPQMKKIMQSMFPEKKDENRKDSAGSDMRQGAQQGAEGEEPDPDQRQANAVVLDKSSDGSDDN